MNNSSRFFENKQCEYYPCHSGIEEMNCLFCYCPLYSLEHCPGKHGYVEIGGKKIKTCEDCTFPHEPGNYDKIIQFLSQK